MFVLILFDCGVFFQVGFCLGVILRFWVLQLMEQFLQVVMVIILCFWETGRFQVLRFVLFLVVSVFLCLVCGQGWEGFYSGFVNRCFVYDFVQLMGIAIGAFLVLVFVGVIVFFMYRKFSQFGEYFVFVFSLQVRRVGRFGWFVMCFEFFGVVFKFVVVFVGNCWFFQVEVKYVGFTEFEFIWYFFSFRFRVWL